MGEERLINAYETMFSFQSVYCVVGQYTLLSAIVSIGKISGHFTEYGFH